MKIKLIPIIAFSAMSFFVHAETHPSQLITNLGCDTSTTQCTLTLGSTHVGPAECASSKVSWNNETTQGKLAVALLSSALMTNHKVSISVSAQCGTNGLPVLESYELLAQAN
ncbi:hypothetical protein P4S72_26720 [Vibrio sp. PP-XX7]